MDSDATDTDAAAVPWLANKKEVQEYINMLVKPVLLGCPSTSQIPNISLNISEFASTNFSYEHVKYVMDVLYKKATAVTPDVFGENDEEYDDNISIEYQLMKVRIPIPEVSTLKKYKEVMQINEDGARYRTLVETNDASEALKRKDIKMSVMVLIGCKWNNYYPDDEYDRRLRVICKMENENYGLEGLNVFMFCYQEHKYDYHLKGDLKNLLSEECVRSFMVLIDRAISDALIHASNTCMEKLQGFMNNGYTGQKFEMFCGRIVPANCEECVQCRSKKLSEAIQKQVEAGVYNKKKIKRRKI